MTLRQQQAEALQAALMAQAVGSNPQVRLAPPTYHVPGVPMIGIDPSACPEGDHMLRVLEIEEDEAARQSYQEALYRHALRTIAGAAHAKGRHFTSETHALLFTYCEWWNQHRRQMTDAERVRYARVASSIWAAQSDVDAARANAEPPRAA